LSESIDIGSTKEILLVGLIHCILIAELEIEPGAYEDLVTIQENLFLNLLAVDTDAVGATQIADNDVRSISPDNLGMISRDVGVIERDLTHRIPSQFDRPAFEVMHLPGFPSRDLNQVGLVAVSIVLKFDLLGHHDGSIWISLIGHLPS
jgi:hypothetical protein